MNDVKRALALGFFDGVHIGHAALLQTAKKRAEEIDAIPSVISFDIHPDNLVSGVDVKLLSDTAGREELINRIFGIKNVVFLHFNTHLMQMPWQEFVDLLISELNASWFVVGHDFTFGNKGEGNALKLHDYCEDKGIGCDVIRPVVLDGKIVSSTYIRNLIEQGNVEQANRFLGHPHCLSDFVHSGYHIGQKLNAPTINMFFPENVIEPKHGVYATKVILPDGTEYEAVTNVGVRPTFSDENKVSVESHLFGYMGNLYHVPARVDFYSFIRPEMKFESYESLSLQIKEDIGRVKEYFLRNT